MMRSKLNFDKGVGERIAAIGTAGADNEAVVMYLFAHATTKERFTAVAALDAAPNRRAAIECVPALKRAFLLGDDRE
jgi:hypothetical protein